MSSLLNAIKSETTKLKTLTSTWIYFILLGGSIGGPVFLYLCFAKDVDQLTFSQVFIGGMLAQMIAVIFGASTTAGEISTKMNAQAFLSQHSRWNWLAARAIVASLFVFFTVAIAVALSVLMITIWPDKSFAAKDLYSLWIYLAGIPAFTLIAVGIAALIRSRVAAVGLPLVWLLVIEPLIVTAGGNLDFVQKLKKFLPAQSMSDMQTWYQVPEHLPNMVAPAFSAVVLAVWVIALLGFGFLRNTRSDVR